jgi:MHS family citrate/tricarballylate:H+ symporter-like MFS transporter
VATTSDAQFVVNPTAGQLTRRHIAAVTLGNALEFYDFLTYAFFAIQIGHALFPPTTAYGSLMMSLATFGAGFVTRPLGAMVIGRYADRVGRKPAMLLCFVLIGSSITVMALIPSYERIGIAAPILAIVTRLVQGFSLGGEVGSNTAYLMEAARPERRGLVVSLQSVSQQVAQLAGGVVGLTLTSLLPADVLAAYGWRIAFLIGGAVIPFGLWLRRSLPETLHSPTAGELAPVTTTVSRLGLARRHRRVLVLGVVVLGGFTIASYSFTYIVTYAQHSLHLSQRAGFIAAIGNFVTSIPALLFAGWLSDRVGRRPVMLWATFAFLVSIYPVYAWISAAPSDYTLIAGMAYLGVLSGGAFAVIGAALSESLPRDIRSTGFGTVYAIAIATFGGTTQLVATWLIDTTNNPLAPMWYLLAATAAALVALFWFPESAPIRMTTGVDRTR